MEFKFGAIDGQASTTYVPPPSSIGYFAEQSLRAAFSFPDFGHSTEFFRNPSVMREAIQRELEKERIREEIVAAEIARCRLLVADLRREMALRRAEGFSIFPGPAAASAMRFELRPSLFYQSEGRLLEERLALSPKKRLGYQALRSVGGFEALPLLRNPESKIPELKPSSEAMPEGTLSGAKRKALTPSVAGASKLRSFGLKKKLKEEWSCALCQVRATSEQALDYHFQGKKHKAMVAGLSAQRTGKNYAISGKSSGSRGCGW